MTRFGKFWTAGIVLVVVALVGAGFLVVRSMNRWEARCHDAGGQVEARYEGDITSFIYNYDAKGNIISVTPIFVQNYSYHCWVGGQEVQV